MPKQETIKRIVEKVNSFIDVPFMTEGQEAIPIEIVVGKVFEFIPEELIPFMEDAEDGLDAEEIDRHAAVFATFLNGYVDVPWVPESVEHSVLKQVVVQVLSLAAVGESL